MTVSQQQTLPTVLNLVSTLLSHLIFATASLIATFNMAGKEGLGADAADQTQVKRLADSGLQFTLSLFKQSSLANTDNLFVSPFSISVALGMTLAGAKNATSKQMKEVLKLDAFEDEVAIHDAFKLAIDSLLEYQTSGIKLLVANRMYAYNEMSPLPEFKEILEKKYSTTPAAVDFLKDSEKIRLEINKWVEESTACKIRDLLERGVVSPATKAILVNAIYFKGDWANKFDPVDTTPQDFFVTESKQIVVNMMHKRADYQYGFSEELKCQIVELPYVNQNLSMFIILPRHKQGLKELEQSLTPQAVVDLVFYMSKTKLILSLPKFKVESSLSLQETLFAMGMKDLFCAEKADLSGINGGRDLFVSAVIHKAFLEVNEEGSEAAAATAVLMMRCMAVMEPRVLVDHPFIVFIRDNKTGCVLFWGRVIEPVSI